MPLIKQQEDATLRLAGKHLFIGTIDYPPYVLVSSNQGNITNANVDGYIHQIIGHLARKYLFNFTYVTSIDGAYGAPVNNSGSSNWNGLIGMILRQEIDLAAAGLSVTHARSAVVDLTAPIYEDPVALLIPYPEVDGFPIEGLANAFKSEVWVAFVGSLLVCSSILWFAYRLEKNFTSLATHRLKKNDIRRRNIHEKSVTTYPWILFRILFNADYFRPESLANRIALGVWCLTAVVMLNAYTGSLVAHLTATKQKAVIDSLEDWVDTLNSKGQELLFTVEKYTSFETAILTAKSGSLAKVRESLVKHPENSLTDTAEIAEVVAASKRMTYAEERSALMAKIDADWKEHGQCRLSIAKKPYDVSKIALALPKSSPLTEIFNGEIYRLREVGVLDYWYRLHSTKPNRCSAPLIDARLGNSDGNNVRRSGRIRLTLAYLYGAFVLLAAGFSASLFVLLVELIVGRIIQV